MRAELGEHGYATWLAPLQVVPKPNGSPTLSAPNRFHRDHVIGRYGSRLETLAGMPVEVVLAGEAPAAPTERPAPSPPGDQLDLSQILQPMPPDDDCPPPASPPRRKTGGFTREEIAAGALDERRPGAPPASEPAEATT